MEFGNTRKSRLRRRREQVVQMGIHLLEPWRWVSNPLFFGMENIPNDRPLLIVGNHTLYGLLDFPLLFAELYRRKGIQLRSLGHHVHFKVPYWAEMVKTFGAVDGTRENCARLMADGAAILVYPGGAREVSKRHGEKYQVIWNERLGFVRMAIEYGCAIAPFASVGVEDAFDVIIDADQIYQSPIGKLWESLGLPRDLIMPLATGIGPTLLPRPQRYYFKFGEPIFTEEYGGNFVDDERCYELRDCVQGSIEDSIAWLREYQANDPKRVRLPALFG